MATVSAIGLSLRPGSAAKSSDNRLDESQATPESRSWTSPASSGTCFYEDFRAREKGLLYPTPAPENLPHWRDAHIEDLAPAAQVRAVAEFAGRWHILSSVKAYLAAHRDALGPNPEPRPDVSLADHVLRQLARPYPDHPDFQPE